MTRYRPECLVILTLVIAACGSAKGSVAVLEDNLNDNFLDPTKWPTRDVVGTSSSISEVGSELRFGVDGANSTANHAWLWSQDIDIPDWTELSLTGAWRMTNVRSAEFHIFLYDADDPTHWVNAFYHVWEGKFRLRDNTGMLDWVSRSYRTSMTPFDFVITPTGLSFYENSQLVVQTESTALAGASALRISLGTWEYSRYNTTQWLYYDDLQLSVEETPVPAPGALMAATIGLAAVAAARRKRMAA
ncbi:MAG: hypothetical protein V2A58_07365 [Planctomycetota bacterium]